MRLSAEVEQATDLKILRPVFYRLDSIIKENSDRPEVSGLASSVREKLVAKATKLSGTPPLQTPSGSHVPSGISGAHPPVEPPSAVPPTSTQPAPAQEYKTQAYAAQPAPTPAPEAASAGTPGTLNWKLALAVGGVLGVVLFGGIVVLTRGKKEQPPPPPETGKIAVNVQVTPPGAAIKIDSKPCGASPCQTQLDPGTYTVEASLNGYELARQTLTVTAGQPSSLSITLEPSPIRVRLLTDLDSGQVFLDGQPQGELQEGQYTLERIPPGAHQIKVAGKGTETTFAFDASPGSAPKISGPIQTKNILAVVVSSYGDKANAFTSAKLKVALDGNPVGEASPEGLEVSASQGDHQLTLGEGKDAKNVVASFGPAPILTAYLKLDINAGTLLIATGEDDVKVLVDGRERKQKTSKGQLRIPFLNVKEYTVAVAKEGYEASPAQKVLIKKGEETRVEFSLKAIPKLATLRVRQGQPGATVLMGSETLGAVAADGTFSANNISPGEHTFEFRLDKYQPKKVTRQFTAGAVTEIVGVELALAKVNGTLRLTLSPSDSRVTLRLASEPPAQARVIRDLSLSLPEGQYVLTASAPNFNEKTLTVSLAGGENKGVDLQLQKIAPKQLGMADWDDPSGWKAEGGWLMRRGGNFVLFRPTTVTGTFVFTVMLAKGRRVQWVTNYLDDRNYTLFQLEKRQFTRKEKVNGRENELGKVNHNNDKTESWAVQVDVSPTMIVHRMLRDGRWEQLDAWTAPPGRNFSNGKFGFYLPGGDQIGLSNFSYTPR
ncbi:MAG: PEGA domain-containing protein [Bryobacteraceae bacterium]|nr:PEGA domain-containing protein [Bryobacteraceae bacterium]